MKTARVLTNEGQPREGALQVGDTVAEIIAAVPADWPDEIKALFIEVDHSAEYRATWSGAEWVPVDEGDQVDPVFPEPAPPAMRKQVSRVEFKMLFTQAERIKIRKAREYSGTNAQQKDLAMVIDDFFEIIEDPQLTMIDLDLPMAKEGLEGLAAAGLISADRVDVILAGVPQ